MAAVYIPVFIAIGIIAIFSIIYFAMAGTISGFSPNAIFSEYLRYMHLLDYLFIH